MANGNGDYIRGPGRAVSRQMRGAPEGVPQLPMPEALTQLQQGTAGAMFAAALQKKIGNRDWDWYCYQATWTPLAALAPGQAAAIQIDSDADFLAIACVGIARQTAAPAAVVTDRAFLLTARSGGTGADLFQGAVDFDMVVGTAQNPAWWGMPRLIARSSGLALSLQNLVNTAFNVRLGFWGIKVYV